MRYVKVVFLCDPPIVGYMEVDENGSLVRLTDANGATYDNKNPMPDQAYSVINEEPDKPAWGV